ncbi:SusC/RagA family TonB-linked outer membrane protein [Sphingobacterium spiritivorum]|uniref:SusC/RagA family TonB-linked outer membrane protein n=1 Tax=Sphingobacterium spiritivorum TaxID=258 RepID=UPI00191B08A8|nr:SusC/RagA family TonB-linked outer membrane protein [Sphingobacterium spiritivorum]QQT24807.1 SusC/RagA family TonB-linked outer membrane protein [Sphingobacterium spiritivorum]
MKRLFLTQFMMLFLLFLWIENGYAQDKKLIRGTVSNNSGKPISGVTVLSKLSRKSTSTDAQGKYAIESPGGQDILTFNSLGFTSREEPVNNRQIIDIILNEQSKDLDEVVVVGYGTRSKQNVGGAVISVDKKLLKDRPVTNTLSALQGAAPGLVITRTNGQPGREGWTARIRGITTLGTQNAPLVIIDGVEGDINTLNPNDIEDLTVLEDAASAAIYGAKAGGGVIVVRTKAGKANQKTSFDVNSMYTWRTPYARPELLSSRRQAELQNAGSLFANQPVPFSDEQLAWLDDPNINEVYNKNSNSWEYFYNNNMEEILLRKQSPQRSINLTASGGSDKSAYLFSMGYLDQQGAFKFGSDSYSRFNSRINYNTKFSEIFNLDARLSFAKERTNTPPVGADGEGLIYNIYSIRATRNPIFTPGTNGAMYAFIGTISNAYPMLKDGGYDNEDKYSGNAVLTLSANQILKGLDLKATYSPGLVLSDRERFLRTVPRYSIDKDMKPIAAAALNPVNSLTKIRPYTLTQNFFTTADYDLKLKAHHFHVLGGYEYKEYKFDQIQAIQRALLLNDFPSLNYTTLANANVSNVSDDIQVNTWISYFGRLSYDYNKKYYAEGIIRRDGSSRLATGNKFQTFYSGNVFWRAAQETWFKEALPWIDEFKIAASYGTAGGAQTSNPNLNNYDFQAALSSGYYPFNDSRTAYFFQGALPADGKSWEIIKTSNIGFDLDFLNRRLHIHYDYFIKQNDNVFVGQQLPAVLGVTPNAANLAAIRVKGWGVLINWKDQFRDGGYFVSANLSDDKNEVIRYDGSVSYGLGINPSLPGHSTNSIYGYKADGYFDNAEELAAYPSRPGTKVGDIKLLDINGDGIINQGTNSADNRGDLVYLGNTNPRYVFGLSAGVNWKGFDFSVLFNGVGKRSIGLSPSASIAFYDGWRMPWAIHEDYWRPDNLNAKFPAIRIGDRINDQESSHWVQNASYIRLKNIQLGYTITKEVHRVKQMGDIRIFFSGQDLWEKTGMWFNYYDPENTDRVGFSYPLWRSFALGLHINF